MPAQFFPVVRAIEGRKPSAQALAFFCKAAADLLPLEFGVAQGPQALAQQANAAVVERHGRLPGPFRVRHMLLHQGRMHERLAHFFHKGLLFLPDAGLAPVGVIENGLAQKVGIAQQKDIVEGVRAVPVLRPVVHLTKKVHQRGFQPGCPAGFHRGRSGLFFKLHVHLGEHKKERWRFAGAHFRRFAVGGAYPFIHGLRQILHFLGAGSDAEQHAGELFFFAVALKKIGHLAAQKEFLEHVLTAVQRSAQIAELVARAVSGKVQQVGVVKEIVRLFTHVDGDFGREGRHQRARQISLAALRAHKGQHVRRRLVEALQARHVNNAVAAGYERINGAACLGSVAKLAQGRA